MPRWVPTLLLPWLLGAPIAVGGTPKRIASCTVAGDEMATAVLERAGALDRLKAVSTLANDPRYSNMTTLPPHLLGRCGGELESLLKLKPDLAIVASFNRPELLRRLKEAKVSVHVLREFRRLDDIEAALAELGVVLDEPKAAAALVAEFAKERQALASHTSAKSPPRVLQFTPDGLVSGGDTLFDDIVRAAGGINIGAEDGRKGWPRLQAEAIATLRPDVVLAAGEPSEQAMILKGVQSAPGFKEIPAVKAGALIVIPERELSAASPHVLKAIAKLKAGLAARRGAAP